MIKVYYPSQYPSNVSPAQRFRVEQFEYIFLESGVKFYTFPFISQWGYSVFFKKGYFILKILAVLWGFIKRVLQLFILYRFDVVFIQREASPIGPPIFEWLYAQIWKKKIIYDIDDAIWLPKISENNRAALHLKCFWKIGYIAKWATDVIAGNKFLFDYIKNFNERVSLVPTCVDTSKKYNQLVTHESNRLTIGWTGSFSTMIYLELLVPVLKELERDFDFNFIVISNEPPRFDLKNLEYVEWNEMNEIQYLLKCQIGVMPMERDIWSKGKCGFKIIQYMALGIVPVADNWGANRDIIVDNNYGCLVNTASEWLDALRLLMGNIALRKELGQNAKEHVEQFYSVRANVGILLEKLKY